MFSLSVLAYYSCNSEQKDWYNTVPKGAPKIELHRCCVAVLKRIKGEKTDWRWSLNNIAATNAHTVCLEFMHENGLPWCEYTCFHAAEAGHLDVLQYLREKGCPWDSWTCVGAARGGHLDVLKYARANGCPWDHWTCYFAAQSRYIDVFQYARDNGCPWGPFSIGDNMMEYAYYHRCSTDELNRLLLM